MTSYASAARDLRSGFRRFDIWLTLAWMDLALRYRRTMLGPLWLLLSAVINIAIMGFVYPLLLGIKLEDYFPYLACGLALWSLIAGFANDAPGVFVGAAHMAHQTPLPFSLYVFRRVANAFIQFLHTSVSFWAVAIIFHVPFGVRTLAVIPGMAMLCLFGCWLTLVIGVVSLRYRDLGQVIGVMIGLLFLVTPIFWKVEILERKHAMWLASCNPVYHLLEICRAPLLGQPVAWTTWLAVTLINVLGCSLAFVVFARFRKRLAFWM